MPTYMSIVRGLRWAPGSHHVSTRSRRYCMKGRQGEAWLQCSGPNEESRQASRALAEINGPIIGAVISLTR